MLGKAIVEAQRYARPSVVRLMVSCPEDVDDVLQDAALRALRTRSRFRGESAFGSWFTRVAINSALIHLRSGQSRRARATSSLSDMRDAASAADSPEQAAACCERHAALLAAVGELPMKLRAAALGYLRGDACGDDNVLKSRRFRARHMLIERLGGTA